MGKVTFANSKINETISGERQRYQSHITSAGVFETGPLAAETADNLKDSAAYVETILREAIGTAQRHLALGERVTIDGLCRLEIAAEGSSPSEDAPWDPAANRLVVNAIAYDAVKFAAKDLVPENVLKPVQIQLLGAQDATTFEQNAVVRGHTLLCQGRVRPRGDDVRPRRRDGAARLPQAGDARRGGSRRAQADAHERAFAGVRSDGGDHARGRDP